MTREHVGVIPYMDDLTDMWVDPVLLCSPSTWSALICGSVPADAFQYAYMDLLYGNLHMESSNYRHVIQLFEEN